MKIKNFEVFAKRVAKKLNTEIFGITSDRIWFDNNYYIYFDGGFINIADYTNDSPITVMSAFICDYKTQKDFFHDFEMIISAYETAEAPEAPKFTEGPEETTDHNTHDEKWHTYLSVYRDLQQTLTHLRKCKTPRTYDICIGRYIRKSRKMYAENKISKSMLNFIESKISMQNAESSIWASEYERATGCHKSRRYNNSRVDAE